jgi:hypothetical protein
LPFSAIAESIAINSGGRVSVNGWSITIPENLIVQFPNSYIPFGEFAAGNFGGDEVLINGNVVSSRIGEEPSDLTCSLYQVGGVAIAAQVQIAENLANFGQGYIDTINYEDGSMKIVGGPTIRINDPNAVFSVGHTAAPAAYTADDESPSITSFSGFPMCIPRNSTDPLCPLSNRIAGQGLFKAPDPLVMVPFMPGDFIEFSGIRQGGEVIAYAINSPSVMVTTAGIPTYIRVEDAVFGIFDGDVVNNEFGDSKLTGYVSDPSVTIAVYAVDVDPCNGQVTDRAVGNAVVKQGEIRNKWEWRADTTTFSKYTREYKVKVSTGTVATKNGLIAGQYVQPITEWILPELLNVGQNPIPYDWSGFPQLTNGIFQDGFAFGPLSPWPGASAPAAPPACTRTTPVPTASAVPTSTPTIVAIAAITQIPGSLVTLRANLTNTDLTFNDVNVTWTQTSGPAVELLGANTAIATFISPLQGTTAKVVRAFVATAVLKDNNAKPLSGSTNTTVTTDRALKDVVNIDSYTWTTRQGGTIAVVAHSDVVVDGSSKLQLFLGTSTTAIDMVDMGSGIFSYGARSIKKVVSITVKSVYGGSMTITAATS